MTLRLAASPLGPLRHLLWLAAALGAGLASPPEIAAVRGGDTRIVYGEGLVPGDIEIRALDVEASEEACLEALAAPSYAGRALLPPEPPEQAVKRPVLEADAQGRTLAADFTEAVCWARNADGWSRPALSGTAEPLLAYPSVAFPGDTVRLYGRHLKPWLVALRAADGGHVVPLEVSTAGLDPDYECSVRLPADLDVGQWQIYVHNKRGGAAGWGGPLGLRVQARPPAPINVTFVDARLHGARGNGIVDETNSLRQALIVAAKTRDTVVMPPGRYPLRGTLEIPPGVSLVGAGAGNTIIEVQDGQPLAGDFPFRAELDGVARDWQVLMRGFGYAPMVWLRDQSTLSNLTLEAGPGVGMGVMVAACPGVARDVRIERCRIRCGQPQRGQMAATSVLIAGDTERLTLRDCDIVGHDGITFLSANNQGALISRNTVLCQPRRRWAGMSLRGLTQSVVAENRVADGAPNLRVDLGQSMGAHELGEGQRAPLASFSQTVITGNQLLGGSADARPAPSGESKPVFWQGSPKACDETTLTVDGEPFWSSVSGAYVVVSAGRGVGQYRRVISNTANTLTVSPAWDVTLDASSQIAVDGYLADTLWLDQADERSGIWNVLAGFSVGNTVSGLDLSGGGHVQLIDRRHDKQGPTAFNTLVDCTVRDGHILLAGRGVSGNAVLKTKVTGSGSFAAIAVYGAPDANEPPRAEWNLVEQTILSGGVLGVSVGAGVEHAIVRGNHVAEPMIPLKDETGKVIKR